jgi:membrane protease YdiL (CAAX protease family)
LIFGVAYEYTGNLVVVAGMHALYDALIFGMLYLVFA